MQVDRSVRVAALFAALFLGVSANSVAADGSVAPGCQVPVSGDHESLMTVAGQLDSLIGLRATHAQGVIGEAYTLPGQSMTFASKTPSGERFRYKVRVDNVLESGAIEMTILDPRDGDRPVESLTLIDVATTQSTVVPLVIEVIDSQDAQARIRSFIRDLSSQASPPVLQSIEEAAKPDRQRPRERIGQGDGPTTLGGYGDNCCVFCISGNYSCGFYACCWGGWPCCFSG